MNLNENVTFDQFNTFILNRIIPQTIERQSTAVSWSFNV